MGAAKSVASAVGGALGNPLGALGGVFTPAGQLAKKLAGGIVDPVTGMKDSVSAGEADAAKFKKDQEDLANRRKGFLGLINTSNQGVINPIQVLRGMGNINGF